MNHFKILFFLIIFIQYACNNCRNNSTQTNADYFNNLDSGIQTGGIKLIPIKTPKGTVSVWTKRIGNNPMCKVLILHGGPGGTHDGYECFESFLPKENIELIYYDQLACGNSDNPKDTSLYNLNRFVEEVEQVRIALDLNKNNFYLLGHSWGGLLAMQYALKYQQNIKALIISNMMASCPKYGKYADEVLAKQMPPKVLDSIRLLEKKKDFDNPKYVELLLPNFYAKHILRLENWPEPINRMFAKLNKELYVTMQGPSEFGISGKLANWDVSNELKFITIPTLVIGATFDTMDPNYMEWMSKQLPNGQFLLCKNGSHCSFYDDQQTYFKGLIKFIQSVK